MRCDSIDPAEQLLRSPELDALRSVSSRLHFSLRTVQDGRRTLIDLAVDGTFVRGADNASDLRRLVESLAANEFKWVKDYGMVEDPLEWIDQVRAKGWTWQHPSWEEPKVPFSRAVQFSGNVAEYSAAFRYLLLDPLVITEVRRLKASVRTEHPWNT